MQNIFLPVEQFSDEPTKYDHREYNIGGVVICAKEIKNFWHVWLKDDPDIRVRGESESIALGKFIKLTFDFTVA